MSAITQAIHDKLTNDTKLTDMLATYYGMPAIFTQDPAPEGAEYPYIITAGHVADTFEGVSSKTRSGRDIERDIRCYVKRGDMAALEEIAERVRELFHRQPLVIAGWETVRVNASGPVVGPEEDTAHGLIVTISFTIQEG